MSKILKNQTASDQFISDVGVTVLASSNYTINPSDYLLFADSSDVIVLIGDGTFIVNDGTNDLSISEGTDLIKGIFPKSIKITDGTDIVDIVDDAGTKRLAVDTSFSLSSVKIKGDTDDTLIGNTGDALHTHIQNTTPIPVDGDLNTTAFGELSTLAIDPILSLEPTAGLKTRDTETFTSGTGSSAGIKNNSASKEFSVQCGTDVGGYGVLRTKKTLRYRPGIGSLARFTAKFDTPVANSIQRAGFFNIGNELTFGYDGTQFGILRKTGGRPEIRELAITTSSNQSTNITVTLDGTAFVVAVTNASAEQNAYEIATGVTYTGWNVINQGDHVIFQAEGTGSKNGTYSAVPDSGNFVGSFTQDHAGATETDNWVYQSNWSETTLTSGSDPFILDHQKGNVYQIQFQYLGYGQINFLIENPDTGDFVPVHKIKYTNTNTQPSLDIPHMKLGIISASAGSTTDLDVRTASMAGFNESTASFPLNVNAYGGDIKGIATTREVIIAIRKNTTNSQGHLLEVNDVKLEELTVAADASKPVFFEMILNPTMSNPTLWEDLSIDGPVTGLTEPGGTVSGGELIYSVAISKSSNLSIPLKDLDVIMSNDDVVAIVARTTAGSADVAAAIVWGSK